MMCNILFFSSGNDSSLHVTSLASGFVSSRGTYPLDCGPNTIVERRRERGKWPVLVCNVLTQCCVVFWVLCIKAYPQSSAAEAAAEAAAAMSAPGFSMFFSRLTQPVSARNYTHTTTTTTYSCIPIRVLNQLISSTGIYSTQSTKLDERYAIIINTSCPIKFIIDK